jgi:hypothetical protein
VIVMISLLSIAVYIYCLVGAVLLFARRHLGN